MGAMLEAIRREAKTYVPASGPIDSPILVVGEQPGREEVLQLKPFVGASGKLLRKALNLADLDNGALRYTNVLKDLDTSLEGYLDAPKSRVQSPKWIGRGLLYSQAIREEVLEAKYKLLIAVGNVALAALTGRWGINKWRGSLLRCFFDESRYVLPVLHPSSILRGQSENKYLLIHDLKKIKPWIENGFQLAPRKVLAKPSLEAILQFMRQCYEEGMNGQSISFDIEIKNLQLNCFSLSWRPDIAMSIPLVGPHGDLWAPPDELKIMKGLAAILSSRTIRKVGQNLVFDTHFMLRRYGIRSHTLDDSMIAHHTLLPQLPKGLDMITSIFTDVPYYKDEGKEWMRGRNTYEKLWEYNGLDSLTVAEAFPKIMSELIQTDNVAAYERQLSILEPCCYMMERGIRVNKDSLEREREQMRAEALSMRKELEFVAPGLNPQSPKQMQEFFYGKLGIKPYLNKKRKVSCDADALKKIAAKKQEGSNVARLILGIKKREKLIASYLENAKFDQDDRIRCNYNPAGTLFSRLSSSKSIFGTGMNMQNWPHSMLRFLEPDEGYVAYTMDLSQAENRIVAYVGNIAPMIEAFETGKDVHRLTASLIFGKPPEEISDEPGSCSLGNGDSTERQWGKKANHGLNYDLGYKSFALYYDLPLNEAKFIVSKYHEAYPQLRKNFHGYVKESLRKNRYLTNLMGRKTIFLSDLVDETFKDGYACIPQGTVGDVINERGIAYLYYSSQFKEVELIQTVHDSITFQIPLSMPWLYHAMVLDSLKKSLETPLTTHYGREFVIPVDTVMGLNLMKEDGKEMKAKNWPSTLDVLVAQLESNYQELVRERDARF